ncbi:MAG: extensin family protein [Myxococcota bacterium]
MRAASLLILFALSTPVHAQGLRARLAAAQDASVPRGTLTSIEYLLDAADRMERREFTEAATSWRQRASRYLRAVEEGRDPYPAADGEIVNRGYRSAISPTLQGYAVYLPPDYDPSQRYPLYIALHGGSSNGNLFLGVVLGNNMDWLTYNEHLFDDYVPRWRPNWIVVAPTGFGQVMWRWMGEQDVLDVLDDVERHYSVDENRIVLGGLSNGGVGAYALGARHAWRFSMVQAMAGAPSWLQYLGRTDPVERRVASAYSAMSLAENLRNTDFRYYHGREDGGVMKPTYVEEFTRHLRRHGIPARERWYDAGHDILYRVHLHGRVYGRIEDVRRNPEPAEARVVSGDYRAARQHWLEITRIPGYPSIGEVRGRIEGETLALDTENVSAFVVRAHDAPLGETAVLQVDGAEVYRGPAAHLGHRVHLVRGEEGWALGFPSDEGRIKKPGVSGPISDAYFGRMVHVYGTRNAEHTDALREAAERGARGWPLWAWHLNQEVVADSDVTEAQLRDAHVVLYGSAGDNALLQRVAGALPIQVEADAIVVGSERYEGANVGTRFVYPNPLAPHRYVIVQGGVTPAAVALGNKLPEFVGDYVVYDARSVRGRQGRVRFRNRMRASGFFDDHWRLPGSETSDEEGAGPDQGETAQTNEEVEPALPIPPAPPVPEAPRRFGVPRSDQAGAAIRRIWARVPTFINFRAEIPGATWRNDRRAMWSVRAQQECYDALAETEVPFRPRPEPSGIVPSPVEILGPVDGVWFRMTHEEQPLVMSCEMAARLPALIAVLKEHGVHGVEILSSYRDTPSTSFHTMGLALDLARFWTDDGWLSVLAHYEETPLQETCRGPAPRARRARTLRRMACDLARTRLLSSTLTPNYNAGHRNHFHIDARPNDPRIFVR